MNQTLKAWLDYIHNDWRFFPKVIAGFIAWMFYNFTFWLTGGFEAPLTDIPEWAVAQWALAFGVVIGFAKWYMDGGRSK